MERTKISKSFERPFSDRKRCLAVSLTFLHSDNAISEKNIMWVASLNTWGISLGFHHSEKLKLGCYHKNEDSFASWNSALLSTGWITGLATSLWRSLCFARCSNKWTNKGNDKNNKKCFNLFLFELIVKAIIVNFELASDFYPCADHNSTL